MKILMILKSDTIPGSGTSLAGIIDRDIAYDKSTYGNDGVLTNGPIWIDP